MLLMNIAIVLAGGSGTRIGGDLPKQFIDICNKPLIIHTLDVFNSNPKIDNIIVICREDFKISLNHWVDKFNISKVKDIISGGLTRQESVFNGLAYLKDLCSKDDIVLIHDGARPLVSSSIIDENIALAQKYKAVNTVIPSADTIIKSIDKKCISSVPDRRQLFLAQTPQSFQYTLIMRAHELALNSENIDATDDCQLVLNLGQEVHLASGSKLNFKITTPEDLVLLKTILNSGILL